MATNKHAQIRYQALDKCFSNAGRMYFLKDLLHVCNTALMDYAPSSSGIARRQLFEDIRFMESEQGWSIPLERYKHGRQVYYRYADLGFSINNQPLNDSEAGQLRETLLTLSRFKGMPQFGWMEELIAKLESGLGLFSRAQGIMQFEDNSYLHGTEYLTPIFNAIANCRVLAVSYQGFKQPTPSFIEFHPYLLKEYNSRWFAFGWNTAAKAISNLALDRIVELNETANEFRSNDIDFEDYFHDVVGVTVNLEAPVEQVLIRVSPSLWPYVESKPLHGSQRVLTRNEEGIVMELKVQVNFELIALLFSYGEELKVDAPSHLVSRLIGKAQTLLNNYI